MRAVLDLNVLISAFLSEKGAPAAALGAWRRGAFDLLVSPVLLAELERALAYPKLRRRIPADDAAGILALLNASATRVPDPDADPAVHAPDAGDDYLIALAESQQALLVTGDDHLLSLAGELPILTPAAFLERLGTA